jgi:hypothetical protein
MLLNELKKKIRDGKSEVLSAIEMNDKQLIEIVDCII